MRLTTKLDDMQTPPASQLERLRRVVRAHRQPERIAEQEAAPLSVKSQASLRLRHPRAGSYVMGLEFGFGMPMPASTYDFGARVKVELRGAESVIKRTVGAAPSPYFNGPNKSGFMYLVYEVPSEVERECVLSIVVVEPAAEGFYTSSPGRWFVSTHVRK